MIRRTVDDQRNTLSLSDNSTHVREEAAGDLGGQVWAAILGG